MQRLSQTLLSWGLPASGAGLALHFGLQSQWPAAIALALVTTIATLAKGFGSKLVDALQEKLNARADTLAEWIVATIEHWVIGLWWRLTANFYRDYYQSIIYRYRDFRTQGLKTRGPFVLDLDQVFVPLRLAPVAIQSGVSLAHSPSDPDNTVQIWQVLVAMQTQTAFQRLVLLGAAGSGKTTILEHIALTYARGLQGRYGRKVPKLLPLLIYLRDVRAKLVAEEPPTLEQVIQAQLEAQRLNPPKGWVAGQLDRGRVLVMLDGLDEVAEAGDRRRISTWVNQQMQRYPTNAYLLTSRPYGYRDAPLEGVTVLEAQAFRLTQIEQFLQNWYQQAETLRRLGKRDRGVRQLAQTQAQDLIDRIRHSPALAAMALNPLLLTMIAIVHAYRGALPGRRVDLYAEMCEVLLGRRQDAVGLTDGLTALTVDQKKAVLQSLAYKLTSRRTRQFKSYAGGVLIQKKLQAVAGDRLSPQDFFTAIETVAGLLVERQTGVYEFTHRSFQEYLTAVQIQTLRREFLLTRNLEDPWWEEVIRLYAAQNDASSLVWTALQKNTVATLSLAYDCVEEGLSVDADLRQQLDLQLRAGLESADPEVFRLAAEVKLTRRLQRLLRLDDQVELDLDPISYSEYQLFLDDQRAQGREFRPDDWGGAAGDCQGDRSGGDRFRPGLAMEPVRGVRAGDAEAFCQWLTLRLSALGDFYLQAESLVFVGNTRIRLPRQEEMAVQISPFPESLSLWCTDSRHQLRLWNPALATQPSVLKRVTASLVADTKGIPDAIVTHTLTFTAAQQARRLGQLLPQAAIVAEDPLHVSAIAPAQAQLKRWAVLPRWERSLEMERLLLLHLSNVLLQHWGEYRVSRTPSPQRSGALQISIQLSSQTSSQTSNLAHRVVLPELVAASTDLLPSSRSQTFAQLLLVASFWQKLSEFYRGLAKGRSLMAKQNFAPSAALQWAERYQTYGDEAFRFYLYALLTEARRQGDCPVWEGIQIVRETL